MENTSPSMLAGVQVGDNHAWQRFYDTYKPLVYLRGKAWRLAPHEIDELLMKVMERFFDLQGKFTYDPSKGRFRDFFARVVHNAAIDLQRTRRRHSAIPLENEEGTIDVPDASEEERQKKEWQSCICAKAYEIARQELPPRAIQCWTACCMKQMNARDVAAFEGISLATVYNDCNLVWKRLKELAKILSEE